MQTENMSISLKLRQAAAAGNLQEVQKILQSNQSFDIDEPSSNGNTALLWAAVNLSKILKENPNKHEEISRYEAIIKLLLSHHAKDTCINKINQSFYSLIFESKNKIFHRLCHFAIEIELKKIYGQSASIESLKESYYAFLNSLFFLKINEFIHKEDSIGIINPRCGDCVDALAFMKIAKIYKKNMNYYGFDEKKTVSQYKKILAQYSEIHLKEEKENNRRELLTKKKKFNIAVLRKEHMSSEEDYQSQLTQHVPLLLQNDGIMLLTFRQEKDITAYTKLNLATYYKPWSGNYLNLSPAIPSHSTDTQFIVMGFDEKTHLNLVLHEKQIDVITAIQNFNDQVIRFSKLLGIGNIKKSLQDNMPKVFSACHEFMSAYESAPRCLNMTAFDNMLSHLIANLNNWQLIRSQQINLGREYNFLNLARLIKLMIKNVISNQQDSETIKHLYHQINAVNNHIAQHHLEKGNLQSSEAFLMRSISEDMPDSSRLIAHGFLAHLKTIELTKSSDDKKEELFTIIQHNLNIISQAIITDNLDDTCHCSLFVINIAHALKHIYKNLDKQIFNQSNNDEQKEATLKLVYKIYLYLENFIESKSFDPIRNSQDELIKTALKNVKLELHLSKSELLNILQKKPKSSKKEELLELKLPEEPKQQKKSTQKLNKLKKASKQNSHDLVSPLIQPVSLPPTPMTLSTAPDVVINAQNLSSPAIESPKLTTTSTQIDLKKAPVFFNQKKCNTEKKSMDDHKEEAKPSSKIQTHPEQAMLHSISSAYLPANALAGVIPTQMNKILDKKLAETFTAILSRGKIVGLRGKGIKLVSQEECKSREIHTAYIYKLKDPELDERLYGREATTEDLRILGIKNIHPYKKIIIFDLLVEGHKQQAKKLCITNSR